VAWPESHYRQEFELDADRAFRYDRSFGLPEKKVVCLMKMKSLMLIVALPCGLAGTGCGSSTSPAEPTPSAPVATPAPTPTPTPVAEQPQHSPTPAPPCSGCEAPVTNTNPPVRLTIRVYKVQDLNGTLVAGIPASIPLGYTVTIDATPKDAGNKDTLGSGTVDFSFSDMSLIDVGSNHGFQKKLTVLGAGLLEVKASLDGIDSNTLVITLGD
jgi:hypothetical protein